MNTHYSLQGITAMIMIIINVQNIAWRCIYDLESEWPAHNQGKTPGWLAGEKTHYNKVINEVISTRD